VMLVGAEIVECFSNVEGAEIVKCFRNLGRD
jgi:hypothetical protein